MKTNFTTAAIAATFLAMSAEGQNLPRLLQDDTCPPEDQASRKSFDAEVANSYGTAESEEFFLQGEDGQALCTDAGQIEMGIDNRAFVLSEADSGETFKHKYLGGTLAFDVNVSDVGCNCAAGVFLVALDDP